MINLIYTFLCIACLCLGYWVGVNVNSKKKINLPHPIEKVKRVVEEQKVNEEIKEQIDAINTIYENIENYDGTSKGQKEVANVKIGL